MKWPETFIRRPTHILAMRWTGDNYSDLRAWGAPVTRINGDANPDEIWLYVAANMAQLPLELGEWIAKDELGYYPIKDDGKGRPLNYERMQQDQHA